VRRSPAALVLTVAIGLLDDGKAPSASMVAEETGLPVDEVQSHLAHFVEQGELRTIEGRVVAVSDRMRQACGVWASRTLGDGLKSALTGAIDDAATDTERNQLTAALQALTAIHPGVLEGILGDYLFRYDFVDHQALGDIRATPSTNSR